MSDKVNAIKPQLRKIAANFESRSSDAMLILPSDFHGHIAAVLSELQIFGELLEVRYHSMVQVNPETGHVKKTLWVRLEHWAIYSGYGEVYQLEDEHYSDLKNLNSMRVTASDLRKHRIFMVKP